MLQILITGISGRMGQAVQAAVELNHDACVIATHDAGQDIVPLVAQCDAIIDFSHHTFTGELLSAASQAGKPIVIGTTGHDKAERAAIVSAAKSIPIVFASNFSVGVNTLFWLTRQAARILHNDCDMEVVEMHHKHKIDSPSGTARSLAEILCSESGMTYDQDVMHGRHGNIGTRPAKQIGMHALRGGDVIGDHTVIFSAEGERVEISHKASSRMTFAHGSVRAALWLQDQPYGLYDMQDVLGLNK